MIEKYLRQDGHIIYYVDGLHSRVVVATFNTPERAVAWLAVWQEHAALEAERDALAARLARVGALVERWDEWAFKGLWLTRLRAALADPDPAPDAHTTLAAEMADLHAVYDALKSGELKLYGWDELQRADPAPVALADLTADGYTCPDCGSANLIVQHVHSVNGRLAPLTMQCDDCGRKGTTSTFIAPDGHPLPPDHPAWDAADAALDALAADAEQQAAYDVLDDEGRAQRNPLMHWWDWPASISIHIPWPMGDARSSDTGAHEVGVPVRTDEPFTGDAPRLCEICRERPGVGVVSDAGISWFMCRECAASDWTAAPRGGDADEDGAQ